MGNLRTEFIALLTSIHIIISGLLPTAHKVADNTKNLVQSNTPQINFELPKQALGNSTRKIIELTSDLDYQKVKSSLPGMELVKLGNGRYIVIGNGLSLKDLEKKLSKLKNVKRIDAPKTIKIINPVQKTNPVQNTSPKLDSAVNDTYYKNEWYIGASMANKAWSLINQKREITVAVIDTGIDYNHPDLKNRVLSNLAYNFINSTTSAEDDNGHGTHVSGIIAAEANNKLGITGVAGPLDVKIIPVKVLNSNGEGQTDIIAKGIRYAADAGADVINMSFGAPEHDIDIENAILYAKSKGSFLVAASGNDHSNADNYSPAGDKGVFTVSAVSTNLRPAYFSNYGSSVQVGAPGVSILSTIPGGKYQAWDGTSMSAPVVSGVAALLKAQNPSLTPDQLSQLIDSTAQKVSGSSKDPSTGYGVVNAYNAVKKLSGVQ